MGKSHWSYYMGYLVNFWKMEMKSCLLVNARLFFFYQIYLPFFLSMLNHPIFPGNSYPYFSSVLSLSFICHGPGTLITSNLGREIAFT